MTFRAALAAVATAISLGASAMPAHAQDLDPVNEILKDVHQKLTARNDWCLQVDGQDIVCPPWGYLPYDPRTLLPPPQ